MNVLVHVRMPVYWEGECFRTKKQFVGYFHNLIKNAVHSEEDTRIVMQMVESVWPRLDGASTFDYELNALGHFTCLNTSDNDRLTIGKGTFASCYDVLLKDTLPEFQARELEVRMHAHQTTKLARRVLKSGDRYESTCADCGQWTLCESDHITPFEQLWNQFKETHDTTTYSDKWREPWKAFHTEHATLQDLCSPCHKKETKMEAHTRAARKRKANE